MARLRTDSRQLALPLVAVARASPIIRTPTTLPRSKRLERALKNALGDHAEISLTDNRSTLVSHSTRRGELRVRVHQMFLDADDAEMCALGDWIATRNPAAEVVVDAFIAAKSDLLKLHSKPLPENAHKGRHHDLRPVYFALNQRYFDNGLEAELTWGKAGSFRGRRRRSITLGTWNDNARRVTIHPALDQKFVPQMVIERVVHHEMCHAVIGNETSQSGRKLMHGLRFQAAEALFVNAVQADAWIEANLQRILRYRGPRRSTS